jgi:hypothetical protein
MKFEDLLREYNLDIKKQPISRKELLKFQIHLNESFLTAGDEITNKNIIGPKIKALNEQYTQELHGNGVGITNNKRELLDLIDDLLDMIGNPSLKLSREQLIAKLQGYREQLRILEQ